MAAPPNIAYAFGTTPTSGGYNAMLQAITSLLLGVNTTITAAISSTGLQTVTPASMTNIGVGTALWINWNSSDQECVSVTATGGSTFSANFTRTHTGGMTVTVGLPSLGVVSPWTSVSVPSPFTTYGISKMFVSNKSSAAGQYSYVPIIVGTINPNASPIVTMAIASADDIDTTGSPTLQFGANAANGPYSTNVFGQGNFALQDASFLWWAICTEYSIAIFALLSGSIYQAVYAGALRCPGPLNTIGATTATTSLTASGSNVTIPLAVDITKNLLPGQNIMIINQSHLGSSAHFGNSELQTVVSVSGGVSPTVTVTSLTNSYDTGAAIGNIPQNVAAAAGQTPLQSQMYMSRNNDGTWTSADGQAGTMDASAFSQQQSYSSPTGPSSINSGLFAGELDPLVYQTSPSSLSGISGFLIGVQFFTAVNVSSQDYFSDLPLVWKLFSNGTVNSAGLGPIVNGQNTINAIGWVP